MSKRKNKNSSTQAPSNAQQEMANQQITNNVMDSGITQPHSSKKVGLGTKSRRKG